jgi:uncharacterized membrane protein HdeD (DUF308 family)
MSTQTMTANDFAGGESGSSLRGWLIFAGVTLMALGGLAIAYDTTATMASVVVFGWLLALAGAMQFVHAFQVRESKGFWLYLVDAIVRAAAGTLLVIYPSQGAAVLTVIVIFYFIAGGLFRAIASSTLRFPSWGWSLTSGVISILLGVMLSIGWPTSAQWFIGLAVGIDMLVYGWALLMFAAAVKKVRDAFA